MNKKIWKTNTFIFIENNSILLKEASKNDLEYNSDEYSEENIELIKKDFLDTDKKRYFGYKWKNNK